MKRRWKLLTRTLLKIKLLQLVVVRLLLLSALTACTHLFLTALGEDRGSEGWSWQVSSLLSLLLLHLFGQYLLKFLRHLKVQSQHVLRLLNASTHGLLRFFNWCDWVGRRSGCVLGALGAICGSGGLVLQVISLNGKVFLLTTTLIWTCYLGCDTLQAQRFESFECLLLDTSIHFRLVILVVAVFAREDSLLLRTVCHRLTSTSLVQLLGWAVFSPGAWITLPWLSSTSTGCPGGATCWPRTLTIAAVYLRGLIIQRYIHRFKQICLQFCHVLLVVKTGRIAASLAYPTRATFITRN